MSHLITPGNIFLAVIALAVLIAAIRYSGKAFARLSEFIGAHRRATFAILPIFGCNGTAFTGQLFFFRDHAKSWPVIGVVLFAATMESIALYLASEAAERERKNVASFNVRMASYAFGLFVGVINYSHYANPDFRPTVFALIFGSMSALSPWLWAMYGRGQAYESQLESGLIEARGVKFAKIRWIMWPKETFGAMRLAAWTGERNPDNAIRDWETREAAKRTESEAAAAAAREAARIAAAEAEAAVPAALASTVRLELEAATSKADKVRVALRHAPEGEASTYVAWLTEHGVTDVNAGYVRQIRANDREREATNQRSTLRAIGAGSA
jgi:hypothetical protein